MYDNSGIRRYQETDHSSMSPEKMIVLLYEAINRHENTASEAAAAGDKLAMNKAINMAQRIITELRGALDHTIGGAISANLDALYSYMFRENLEALVDQDPQHFANVLAAVAPLLEAWRRIPPGTGEKARQELNETGQTSTDDSPEAADGPEIAPESVTADTASPLCAEAEDAPAPPPPSPVMAEARKAYSLSISA